jgi:hypothetical protein
VALATTGLGKDTNMLHSRVRSRSADSAMNDAPSL